MPELLKVLLCIKYVSQLTLSSRTSSALNYLSIVLSDAHRKKDEENVVYIFAVVGRSMVIIAWNESWVSV